MSGEMAQSLRQDSSRGESCGKEGGGGGARCSTWGTREVSWEEEDAPRGDLKTGGGQEWNEAGIGGGG